MDPETGLDVVSNVGIRGERIVEISSEPLSGDEVVDVRGLAVAPGFIDLHAHGQTNEANEYQAHDGVTTALELESGRPFMKEWLEARTGNALINFGATFAHGATRWIGNGEVPRTRPTGAGDRRGRGSGERSARRDLPVRLRLPVRIADDRRARRDDRDDVFRAVRGSSGDRGSGGLLRGCHARRGLPGLRVRGTDGCACLHARPRSGHPRHSGSHCQRRGLRSIGTHRSSEQYGTRPDWLGPRHDRLRPEAGARHHHGAVSLHRRFDQHRVDALRRGVARGLGHGLRRPPVAGYRRATHEGDVREVQRTGWHADHPHDEGGVDRAGIARSVHDHCL